MVLTVYIFERFQLSCIHNFREDKQRRKLCDTNNLRVQIGKNTAKIELSIKNDFKIGFSLTAL